MNARSFLRTVFAGVEEGYAVGFDLHGSRTAYGVPVTDTDELARWVVATDALYSVGVYAAPPVNGSRGTVDDVRAITMLWADVDTDAGSHSRVAPPHAHALAVLQGLEIPPSLIVDSGGGLHAYWMLREPWELFDARERTDARAVVEILQRAVSVRLGWVVDNTADLSRILRVPGTVSRKYDPPRQVCVVGGTKARHEARDLQQWAEETLAGGVVPEAVRDESPTRGRNDTLKGIVAACLDRGESLEYTVAEVLRQDATHVPPLFSDPTEAAHKTPDPQTNALAFVTSIAVSVARKGTGDRFRIAQLGGDDDADPISSPIPSPLPTTDGAAEPAEPQASAFHRWDVRTAYQGDAPERLWLVDRVFPYGVPCMLAAMGDAGKSMLLLDLALKVAGVTGDAPAVWAGGEVQARGGVAFITSEDDAAEVHRRLEGLDPQRRRYSMPHLCSVVPLPSAGGPMPIAVKGVRGPEPSPKWKALMRHLARIPDLRLVILDPLSSFAHVDVNADPVAGAFFCGLLAEACAKLRASVIVAHHMRKTATPIDSPEAARDAIRGTSALVDGVRAAYALWQSGDQKGVQGSRFSGAAVKTNGPASRYVRTYVRDKATGILVDRSDEVEIAKADDRDRDEDAVFELVAHHANEGRPLSRTGPSGVYKHRDEHDRLAMRSRVEIDRIVERMVASGRLVTGDGKSFDRGTLRPAQQ